MMGLPFFFEGFVCSACSLAHMDMPGLALKKLVEEVLSVEPWQHRAQCWLIAQEFTQHCGQAAPSALGSIQLLCLQYQAD